MTLGSDSAARWWAAPPVRQVSYLVGIDPELLDLALDPLPEGAPAVLQIRVGAADQLGDYVDALLDGLDQAAIGLFPRWLPGAERLDPSGSRGRAATRAIAERAASVSSIFGPFLIDLADRSLSSQRTSHANLPAEVRAQGLARVIADAYGRESTVLVIGIPDGLSPRSERSLVAAAEWLVHHGRFTIWLVGLPLRFVDRIRSMAMTLPAHLTRLAAEVDSAVAEFPVLVEPTDQSLSAITSVPPVIAVAYPPVAGTPRQDSPAEQALERALAPLEWAQGRHWNHTYEWHILARPYRLDLFWPDGGVVVEVDGPEHRGRLHYADDRVRDVNLQLCGHTVLRFTNEQVLWDVQAVVTKIEQSLSRRRAAGTPHVEMLHHGEH